ncbi:hypothetical protein [Neobacillus mesonae]|uniref:hypothetical protein n=1 Tax=Neobacillus mesonae TaxID=1193713 RepID=UPI00203FFCC9|nr:hypothetical protein [Neobacillus mesonae]MCM3567839.1 hypothetical protein [Neobacillus mesonae]
MAISTTGHTKMKKWLKGLIKEGRYVINGSTQTAPIFNVQESGDTITFYLYFNDAISGSITKFQLIDQDGEVFDDQPDSISKSSLNGLLVAFKYTIKRV